MPKSPVTSIPLRMYDPRRGDVALTLEPLLPGHHEPGRTNCFSILFLRSAGAGVFHAGLNAWAFKGPVLLFASPYQTFFLAGSSPAEGEVLQFHANFFCIETYHEEVGCNGVLFNDLREPPVLKLEPELHAEVESLFAALRQELGSGGLAHSEILLSYLKVLLIKATRSKLGQRQAAGLTEQMAVSPAGPPAVLSRLLDLVEQHYRQRLGPADYARLLHLTPKALARLVKLHLGKTLTGLIRERTLHHAKWQLLHTRRPIKEVAAEVGFLDELYFSRLFKQETGVSPKTFREVETAIRGGRNLSMD